MVSEIIHSGVAHDDGPPGRGSGRYGWGTGENPHQHQFDLMTAVASMKAKGLKDGEIAKSLFGEKATAVDLRAELSIAKSKARQFNHAKAVELLTECNGNVSEVARRMGKNESTIRSYLDPIRAERMDRYESTAKMLKDTIDKKGMIDISAGTEISLGVPDYTKKVAVKMLEKEGYLKSWISVEQLGTQHETSIVVLAPPGTTHSDVQKNKYNLAQIADYTPDAGKTWWVPEFPSNLDSKRVKVRYAEEGGKDKDGVIEIRKGVDDLSLGGSQYAQVRIAVDGTHYLKGMAIYNDGSDMPKGVDIIFNTNKHIGTPMIGDKDHEVLKRLKVNKETGEIDRDNPFGASIKRGGQRKYTDGNGNEQLSPINKLQEEGDWDNWSRNLSSQFLSKQPIKLINQQIDISLKDKRLELEEIKKLTNPVVKKKLLDEFAGGCDANAADLSVKGFKGQAFQVILPVPKMKDNEIYAPNLKDGETVALIRYPHGGVFEIPVLKVNNRQKNAKDIMKDAKDAVGINPKVAEQLSGADFDGDTACVIPVSSNNLKIKTSKPLKGLEGFDPKETYKLPDSAPEMNPRTKQNEMGRVTNLITDMTVGMATPNEICKAVKHSMVVIDAEKHHLDYKQSARDNDIENLKKTYQGVNRLGKGKGASTILSRASSEIYVDKRKEVTNTKDMTPEELKAWNEGKKVYRTTTRTKTQYKQIKQPSKMTPEELERYKSGQKVFRNVGEKTPQEKIKQMDAVDDAIELVRDKNNPKEMAYANYANSLKGLANEARRESRSIKPTPVNQSAKATYAKEVEDLNNKLTKAKMNKPLERQAQLLANADVSQKFASNPDMDYEHRQRVKAQALNKARSIVGAKKEKIEITDREWEAIQAGAISTNKLTEILNNADSDAIKKRATPKKQTSTLSKAQMSLLKSMINSGMYTQKDIADRLGVSVSTVNAAVQENA